MSRQPTIVDRPRRSRAPAKATRANPRISNTPPTKATRTEPNTIATGGVTTGPPNNNASKNSVSQTEARQPLQTASGTTGGHVEPPSEARDDIIAQLVASN